MILKGTGILWMTGKKHNGKRRGSRTKEKAPIKKTEGAAGEIKGKLVKRRVMEDNRGECFNKKLVSNAAKMSDMMRDEKTDGLASQSDGH